MESSMSRHSTAKGASAEDSAPPSAEPSGTSTSVSGPLTKDGALTTVDSSTSEYDSVRKLETPEEKRIRRRQELWFGSVYFGAGVTNATRILLPIYLRERGVRTLLIGVLQGLDDIALIVKVPAGVLSDKVDLFGYGHRRPFVFLALWVTAALFFGRAILDAVGFSYGAFLAIIILDTSSREFWDKPLDAYATEVTEKGRVGRTQGLIMNGSRAIAILIGLGLSSVLSEAGEFGWSAVFILDGLFLAIPSLLTFRVPRAKAENHFQWAAFKELKRREVIAHAAFICLGAIPTNMMVTVAPLFLEDSGLSNTESAVYLGSTAVFLFVGAVGIGYLIDRHRRHLFWWFFSTVVLAVIGVVFFLVAIGSMVFEVMFLWGIATGLATGAGLAMNYALVMLEIQDDQICGSFMGIFGMFASLGNLIGGFASGALIETIDYTGTLVVILGILLLEIPVLVLVFKGTDYTHEALAARSLPPPSSSSSSSTDGNGTTPRGEVELIASGDVQVETFEAAPSSAAPSSGKVDRDDHKKKSGGLDDEGDEDSSSAEAVSSASSASASGGGGGAGGEPSTSHSAGQKAEKQERSREDSKRGSGQTGESIPGAVVLAVQDV